jgi:MtN3 and saliva related transmembrane protein
MYVIGIVGQLVFYSQAFTIFYNKSAVDVSLLGFFMGFVSVSSWLFYGILLKNRPLIIANTVATIGAALVLLGIFLYA